MGKLVAADEATHKELLADLKVIQCSIRIEPYIIEERTDDKLYSELGVKIT